MMKIVYSIMTPTTKVHTVYSIHTFGTEKNKNINKIEITLLKPFLAHFFFRIVGQLQHLVRPIVIFRK